VEPAAVFTCRGAQVPFEVRASMDNRAIGGGADLFGNKTSGSKWLEEVLGRTGKWDDLKRAVA